MMKKLTSFILALLMVAGSMGSVSADDESEKLVYVSIGDSMTNGYGLEEDKDEDGNNLITKENYPTLLDQSYGYDISGHNGYLEISTKAYPWHVSQAMGWDLIQLSTSASRAEDIHYILEYDYVNDTPGEYKGDHWTQSQLVNNKDRWANDNDSFQNNHGVENAYGVKNVARIYQQSVEKADVISLSLGNGNLGVFMAGTVTNALGIFGVPQQNDWIRFEDAIATLDAETQGILMKMYDTVCAKLTEHLPKDQAEGITRGVSYSLASLIVNYMGAVDRIVELNPDAKIILVGLLNTLDEAIMIMEDNTEVDLGDVMNILIEPLNYFMVAYPVMMQSQGKFPEAEFICMENAEFETVFQNVKNIVPSENPTIRIRYIGNITFNIFSMINSIIDVNEYFELKDVVQYEALAASFEEDPTAFSEYVARNPRKARAISVYLAIEKAMLTSAAEPMTMSSISGLTSIGPELFKGVFDEYEKKIKTELGKSEELINNIADIVGDKAQEVCSLYYTPEVLCETLLDKELDGGVVFGLLNIYTRFKLADGHPSVNGHRQLADSIIKAYDEKYTPKDKLFDGLTKLIGIIDDAGIIDITAPEDYEQAYSDAVKGNYAFGEDSHYVNLGDDIVSGGSNYSQKLSQAIGFTEGKFTDLGDKNLRCEDIRYILDPTFIPDAYGAEYIENIEELRSLYTSEIKKADLITVGTGNFMPYVITQIRMILGGNELYEMDWAKLVGNENVKYVKEALSEVDGILSKANSGVVMGIDLKEVMAAAVESYAYAYTGFAVNYAEMLNDIHEINPEAEVIVVGSYNPLPKLAVAMDGEEKVIGEYIDHLIDIMDTQFLVYSMLTPKTTFVEVNDIVPEMEYADMMILARDILFGTYKLNPSADGHEYIKDMILGSMLITQGKPEDVPEGGKPDEPDVDKPDEEDKPDGQPGDVDGNGTVNALDATQILRYANNKSSVITTMTDVEASMRCDVNADGKINAVDATQILRYCNNKPSSLAE